MSLTRSNQHKPPLETRLGLEALRLKEAAKALRHGQERTAMISKGPPNRNCLSPQ